MTDGLFGRWENRETLNMNDTIVSLGILVYNFLLVAGTAYLVAFYDWSMWTFLLTGLFIVTMRTTKKETKDE